MHTIFSDDNTLCAVQSARSTNVLHCAATMPRHPSMHFGEEKIDPCEGKSAVEILLEGYPDAAKVLDGDEHDTHTSRGRAAPDLLMTHDINTHLYPCLLAASCDYKVDSIYQLPREGPQLLQRAIVLNSSEECLIQPLGRLRRSGPD